MNSQISFQKKEIISHLLAFDQRTMDFLFDPDSSPPCLRELSGVLLDDSWELKSEQQILVRAALDIWSGSGNAFLWELINGLCKQNFYRLSVALVKYRELASKNDS